MMSNGLFFIAGICLFSSGVYHGMFGVAVAGILIAIGAWKS